MGYSVKYLASSVTIMSLVKRLIFWFQGITRCLRRCFSLQYAHIRPPRSRDQQRFGRLLVQQTPHMHALHAIPITIDFNWQTDSDFHYRYSFPHEETGLDTHTHTHTHTQTHTHTHTPWQLWWWTPHSSPGTRPQHDPVFSAFNANFRGFLKLLASLNWLKAIRLFC